MLQRVTLKPLEKALDGLAGSPVWRPSPELLSVVVDHVHMIGEGMRLYHLCMEPSSHPGEQLPSNADSFLKHIHILPGTRGSGTKWNCALEHAASVRSEA